MKVGVWKKFINDLQIFAPNSIMKFLQISHGSRIKYEWLTKQVFKRKRDSELRAFYSHNDITQVKTIVYFINSKKYK